MMANKEEKKIFVLAEKEDGKTAYLTYELLRAGRELADKIAANLCVAVIGHDIGDISEEMTFFTDEVYVLNQPLLKTFQVDFYTYALEELFRKLNPDTVLLGHTQDNMDLAPKLACKIGAQLVTDSIRLDIGPGGEELLCGKPVYGDKAIATFLIERKPRIITLRPKAIEAIEKSSNKGRVIPFDLTIDKSLAKTESIETIPGESVSLDKADAIVAGGRGIKEIEGIKQLEELAQALKRFFSKVELGASRPLVDEGFFPSSRQIGLTGEKVAPEMYIAVAISGSSQHLSGVVGAKKIIAINKDGQASIFESADYGIVGEYEKVVPALVKKLKEFS